MRKKVRWKESWITSFELPEDLAYHDPLVTMKGNRQIIVENYITLLCCSKKRIDIRLFRGVLSIYGKNLWIPCYTQEEIQIRGFIECVKIGEGE